MRRDGWGVSTCVCEYSRGEGWGWRCVGHSLETHTHTHTQWESYEPKCPDKSGVLCDYTEPACPPINHLDYLGQP